MQYEPFQIFVNHNQNKQKTEPKIKKTQNPQYEPFRISTYFHHSTTHKCHFHNLCIFPADVFKDRNHRVAFASCLYF